MKYVILLALFLCPALLTTCWHHSAPTIPALDQQSGALDSLELLLVRARERRYRDSLALRRMDVRADSLVVAYHQQRARIAPVRDAYLVVRPVTPLAATQYIDSLEATLAQADTTIQAQVASIDTMTAVLQRERRDYATCRQQGDNAMQIIAQQDQQITTLRRQRKWLAIGNLVQAALHVVRR